MRRPTLQDRVEYALTRTLEAGVSMLPDRAATRVGEAIGDLVRFPLRIRRDTVELNLRRAFPDADERWIDRVGRATYRHLGREAVMMIRLSHLPPERIVELTDVPAWDALQAAREEGRGALLVTGHYGNWEVAASAIAARGIPTEAVVKPQRNRLVDARVEAARRRLGIGTIDMGSAPKRVPRALRRNHAIGMVADQDARHAGLWVPFFGTPASTYRGPALFALRLGTPVFASIARRLPDGRYHIEMERIVPEETGDLERDVHALTARLARHLEAEIRREPEQYFWFHKRWKSSPPTELPSDGSGTNVVRPEQG